MMIVIVYWFYIFRFLLSSIVRESQAELHSLLGEKDQAKQMIESNLQYAREQSLPLAEIRSLRALGNFYTKQKNAEMSVKTLKEALGLAEKNGDDASACM